MNRLRQNSFASGPLRGGIHLRNRKTLVGWLCEVAEFLGTSQETVFLAVNLLDRFLNRFPDTRLSQLQLVGVTCFWDAWCGVVFEFVHHARICDIFFLFHGLSSPLPSFFFFLSLPSSGKSFLSFLCLCLPCSKFEECFVPSVEKMSELTANAFTPHEVWCFPSLPILSRIPPSGTHNIFVSPSHPHPLPHRFWRWKFKSLTQLTFPS